MSDDNNKLRITFERLIARGVAVPTGEMRPTSTGELQPVYVHRAWARAMGLPLPRWRLLDCKGRRKRRLHHAERADTKR
jgi:hypothetical protein